MSAASMSALVTGERDVRIRTCTERIQRSAQRMTRMIGDLIDFASLHGGRLTIDAARVEPGRLIEAAVELLEGAASERDQRLVAEVEPGLPAVEADRDRIVQALGNLGANAVKVSEVGAEVKVGVCRDGAGVTFYVVDRGPGIPREEREHVFERIVSGIILVIGGLLSAQRPA